METIIKTVKVSDKGQIAIPKDLRKKINLKKGETLIIACRGKDLLLKKPNYLFKFRKLSDEELEKKALLKLSEMSFAKDWNSKEDEIWDTY